MRFRPRRRVVHLQLELRTVAGARLALWEFEDAVCVFRTVDLLGMSVAGALWLDGELRLLARAWRGPAGMAPPLP